MNPIEETERYKKAVAEFDWASAGLDTPKEFTRKERNKSFNHYSTATKVLEKLISDVNLNDRYNLDDSKENPQHEFAMDTVIRDGELRYKIDMRINNGAVLIRKKQYDFELSKVRSLLESNMKLISWEDYVIMGMLHKELIQHIEPCVAKYVDALINDKLESLCYDYKTNRKAFRSFESAITRQERKRTKLSSEYEYHYINRLDKLLIYTYNVMLVRLKKHVGRIIYWEMTND